MGNKKFILLSFFAAVFCACAIFSACNIFGGDAGRKETAPEEIILGEITDGSIEISDCVFGDGGAHFPQLSLDGENWTERLSLGEGFGSYVFLNLEPNTAYTVYARESSRGEGYKPSDAITKPAKTLRTAASGVPENVDFVQEYGKITLTGFTAEMEASFDGGATYGGGGHTYKTKGLYTVLVRFKQTDRAFASEPCEIKVQYSDFFGGLGTEQKPYLISNYNELLKVCRTASTYFKLLNDITFPAEAVGSVAFKGKLDGNGKKLISPKIDAALNADGVSGLFSVGTGGLDCSIRDLTVENITYTSDKRESYANEGLLCDRARTVENCRVSGEMIINEISAGDDRAYFGGIAGYADYLCKIENCTADVKFTVRNGNAAKKNYVFGGIVGETFSAGVNVAGCRAKISVNMTAENNYGISAGGIVGNAEAGIKVYACSAKVDFSALGGNAVSLGGIAGMADGSAEFANCLASGEIVASGNPAYADYLGNAAKIACGGIAGGIYGTRSAGAENCVSAVDISVDGTGADVHCAGIIAEIKAAEEKRVAGCLYAGGIVVNADGSKQTHTGGIIGQAEPYYAVENCYFKTQAPVPGFSAGGGEEVNGGDCLSAAWQREKLSLDETVWTLTDGKLPDLK